MSIFNAVYILVEKKQTWIRIRNKITDPDPNVQIISDPGGSRSGSTSLPLTFTDFLCSWWSCYGFVTSLFLLHVKI